LCKLITEVNNLLIKMTCTFRDGTYLNLVRPPNKNLFKMYLKYKNKNKNSDKEIVYQT